MKREASKTIRRWDHLTPRQIVDELVGFEEYGSYAKWPVGIVKINHVEVTITARLVDDE